MPSNKPNPKSFDDLLAAPPALEPVPVEIDGLAEPILIHQFTWDQFQALTAAEEGAEDGETSTADKEAHIRAQVVKLLRGPDCDPTEAECAGLGRIFSVSQVREIYRKGLQLNGFGAAALRSAEKN